MLKAPALKSIFNEIRKTEEALKQVPRDDPFSTGRTRTRYEQENISFGALSEQKI